MAELEVMMDRKAVAEYCGVTVQTIDNWRKNNGFPKPHSPGRPKWPKETVIRYLQISGRRRYQRIQSKNVKEQVENLESSPALHEQDNQILENSKG